MTFSRNIPVGNDPFSVEIVVSDPSSPRAAVAYPPFSEAIPLTDITIVTVPGNGSQAVKLEMDCRDCPDATALLTPDHTDTRFQVSTFMRPHPTGNGYIIVRIERHAEPEKASHSLDTVLDPITHRTAITALCELGCALIVTRAQPEQGAVGVMCTVDREQLEKAYQAALRHPRLLRYVSCAPDRQY